MSIWSCRPVGSYRQWRWPHDGHDHRNPVPPDGGGGQDAERVRGHGPDLHGGTQRRQLPAFQRGGPVVRRRDRRPTGTGLDGGGDPRTLRTLPSADRRADRPEVGGGPAGGARPHPGPDRRAATAHADSAGAGGPVAPVDTGWAPAPAPGSSGCGPGARWGWSPPPLPADTPAKRRVDRILPRAGLPAVVYFAAVFTVLNLAGILPTRADLGAVGLAALAAGSWCGLNFWRCRHAHCVVTGAGWLALAVFAFVEAGLGHSLIGGNEPPVFLAVLGTGLVFEGAWYLVRGTNAVPPISGRAGRTGSDAGATC